MTRIEAVERGRDAIRRRAWSDGFLRLSSADREAPLPPEDLEQLARAAHFLGKRVECAEILARAHQGFATAGEVERAARCAFWLAFELQYRGELAQGSGWLARARRLLDDGGRDCVERGFLLLPEAMRHVATGEFEGAYATFVAAESLGARFGNVDLVTFARHGQGRALLRMGRFGEGLTLLDEAMVAVTAGDVAPDFAGVIYCSVIEACHEVFDLRRAQEWTSALNAWCASFPDELPYRGHCLIRRAEILQLRGAWPEAFEEARRASERLTQPVPEPDAGSAFYRMAELHRLRGALAEAETAYGRANDCGKVPLPGLALLRLAQGKIEAAFIAIRREVEDGGDDTRRSAALAPFIQIALAAGELLEARSACEALAAIAERLDAPYLRALSCQATGAVLLAEGNPRAALTSLKRAEDGWRSLDAPYEGARVRVLAGKAFQEFGDDDSAEMEWNAAARVFQGLGAAPELTTLSALRGGSAAKLPGGLTAREVEVLVLVATGRTNRAIAVKLGIAEKTVARHVSNIFSKLDLPSRAAATAYAYENGLV